MALALSALASTFPLDILRDGTFSTLGFLSNPRPGMLTFAESRAVLKALRAAPRPLVVLTTRALAVELPGVDGVALVEAPRRCFFEIHNELATASAFYGEGAPTFVHPTARVAPSACLAPKDVTVGPGSVIGPHVTIRGRCCIGRDVVIHPGVVLGGEGFQSMRLPDHTLDLVHAGGIRVDDRVVIHANAVVSSALFHDETVIGADSRIGNLAFVSHNVQVGRACFIGHGAVINGNVTIGDGAWIGPGSTVSDRLSIGPRAHVSLGSAVIDDVEAAQQVTGNVAIEHRRYLRHIAKAGPRRR